MHNRTCRLTVQKLVQTEKAVAEAVMAEVFPNRSDQGMSRLDQE